MRAVRCLLVTVALVLGAGSAGAAEPTKPQAKPQAKLHVAFEKYSLPNGLVVILHEDHRAPSVVVDLWFRVGSKDERKGRTGFAHLFEHLMFMGTKRVPNGGFDTIMEAAGGSNNATTSEDRTNYFESGPSHLLETFLWLEADRLATLPDAMTKAKLDLQRDVVKNERRQSYENRPYGRVELMLPVMRYPEGHPYHHPVIGSHEDLSAARVADVKAFFKTYYVPSNATLVVAGDFKSAEARTLIERYFGWMPKRSVPPQVKVAVVPRLPRGASMGIKIPDAVQLDQINVAWHSPAAFKPGDAAAELLASVLGDGKSSRLYRALVQEQKLAEDVSVEQRGSLFDGMFLISATAQPGHTAEELEAALEAQLDALVTRPITEAELARARAYRQTQLLASMENLFNMADMLATFEFYAGDAARIDDDLLGRYESVSLAELTEQTKLLDEPRRTVIVVPKAKLMAKPGTTPKTKSPKEARP